MARSGPIAGLRALLAPALALTVALAGCGRSGEGTAALSNGPDRATGNEAGVASAPAPAVSDGAPEAREPGAPGGAGDAATPIPGSGIVIGPGGLPAPAGVPMPPVSIPLPPVPLPVPSIPAPS